MKRRRADRDARWQMMFIIVWLLVCIAMLLRWRCVFGPPHL
jgi:hypothetical protein